MKEYLNDVRMVGQGDGARNHLPLKSATVYLCHQPVSFITRAFSNFIFFCHHLWQLKIFCLVASTMSLWENTLGTGTGVYDGAAILRDLGLC